MTTTRVQQYISLLEYLRFTNTIDTFFFEAVQQARQLLGRRPQVEILTFIDDTIATIEPFLSTPGPVVDVASDSEEESN